MLDELERKLTYKFRWPAEQIASALHQTSAMAELIESGIVMNVCRDPDDNRILECALAGAANFIITGDDDLLTLDSWESVQIITVRQFLDAYPLS